MTMIIDLEYIFWETLTVANYRKTPAKRIVQDLFEITANMYTILAKVGLSKLHESFLENYIRFPDKFINSIVEGML